MNRVILGGLTLLLAASTAQPATINVGDHDLLAGSTDQAVKIHVTGGEAVQGMDFRVQVGDGGPEAVGI